MPEAERHTKDYRAEGEMRGQSEALNGEAGDVVIVYATVPTLDLAKEIARALVEASLAACVNILPGMTAIYAWDGVLNEEAEVVLIVKTQRRRVGAVLDAVKIRHPYENPALVVLPVLGGSPAYLDWVQAATRRR